MSNPYAGSTELPPGAAQRTEVPPRRSEMMPGGLFAVGTRVEVQIWTGGNSGRSYVGEVADFGSVPAPHLVLDRAYNNGRIAVFLGPGVVVFPALGDHPAL